MWFGKGKGAFLGVEGVAEGGEKNLDWDFVVLVV